MSSFWELKTPKPEATALATTDRSISYLELNQLVDSAVKELEGATSGNKQVVGLEFDLSIEAIVNYIATLRAGYPVLIVEPSQLTSGSPLSERWLPKYSYCKTSTSPNTLELFKNGQTYSEVHPDLKILLSTSGTTGDPKLVRLSTENIASNASSIAEYLNITHEDVAATTLPLFYSYGLSVLNSYLSKGACIFITDRAVSDEQFWNDAKQKEVTSLALVPHQFEILKSISFDGSILPSLKYITQAGGKLGKEDVEHFHAKGKEHGWLLYVMYGQTEASPRISYVPPEKLPEASETIGIPIPGGALKLLMEDGHLTEEPGAEGELIYQGPNVMLGYATEPSHLTLGKEVEFLETGDIAKVTYDGLFRIVGRKKRFIKVLGKRVSLDQIESYLDSAGIKCLASGNDLKLVLFILRGDENAAQDLITKAFNLPPHGILTSHIDSPPLLPSGKIDHRSLNESAEALAAKQSKGRQSSSVLEYIQTVTGNTKLSEQDSFKGAGGDSLAYLEVQLFFQEKLGYIPANWETKPIAELQNEFSQSSERKITKSWLTLSKVPMDAILRTVAISAVVIQHATTYPIYGGVWILFLLMGLSFSKYQANSIFNGKAADIIKRNLIPIVPLYFAIVAGYSLLKSPPHTEYLYLIGNFIPSSGAPLLEPLWFVSAYTQLIVLLAILALVPWLKPLANQRRERLALPLLFISILLYIFETSLLNDFEINYHHERGLVNCLLLFTIGVTLASKSKEALLYTAGTLVFWAALQLQELNKITSIIIVACAILILLVREVNLPSIASRYVLKISSLSLFIYLTHQLPANLFGYRITSLEEYQSVVAVLTLASSILLAQLTKSAYENTTQKIKSVISKSE